MAVRSDFYTHELIDAIDGWQAGAVDVASHARPAWPRRIEMITNVY